MFSRHARLGSHLLHAFKLHMTGCFSSVSCSGSPSLETGNLALELRNSLTIWSAYANAELQWKGLLCLSSSEFYHYLGLLSLLVFICYFVPHHHHHRSQCYTPSFQIPLNPKDLDKKWKYITLDNSLGALILSKQDLHMETGRKWTRHKLQPLSPKNLELFSGSPHTPWANRLLAQEI